MACRALLQVRQGPCSLTGAKNSPIVVPHPRGLSQGCACEEAGLPHRREGPGEELCFLSTRYAPGTVLRMLRNAPSLSPQDGLVGHCHTRGGSGRLWNWPRSQPGNG